MSIALVVTGGYGNGTLVGSIAEVVTAGYTIGLTSSIVVTALDTLAESSSEDLTILQKYIFTMSNSINQSISETIVSTEHKCGAGSFMVSELGVEIEELSVEINSGIDIELESY